MAHGILGWVAPAVGSCLMRLAERALRPGGLFYLSYNSLPGWLAALPFQHTVRSLQGPSGDGLPALEAARDLFSQLRQADAQVFTAQPGLAPRLEGLSRLDPAYLLHEYNHSQWQPLYANQVIEEMRQLGLGFLGSASLAENFEGVLPEAFRAQIQRHSDPALRELVRDLLTNQSFRRDVYAKGVDPLWPRDAIAALEQVKLCGLMDQDALDDEGAFRFRLGFGEIQGNRDWFVALMQGLRDQPRSLAELRQQSPAGTPLPELLQNLTLLLNREAVALVPGERDPGACHRLNAHLCARVAAGAPYRALACPLSGNIHNLNDVEMLALHALHQGRNEWELPGAIDEGLRSLDRQLLREGQPLADGDRQAELERLADLFRRRTLPLLHRLRALP